MHRPHSLGLNNFSPVLLQWCSTRSPDYSSSSIMLLERAFKDTNLNMPLKNILRLPVTQIKD